MFEPESFHSHLSNMKKYKKEQRLSKVFLAPSLGHMMSLKIVWKEIIQNTNIYTFEYNDFMIKYNWGDQTNGNTLMENFHPRPTLLINVSYSFPCYCLLAIRGIL